MNQGALQKSVSALDCGVVPATVSVSQFTGESGVSEYHLMVCPTEYADLATQLAWVDSLYREACASMDLDAGTVVLKRFFCSDLSNQAEVLAAHPAVNPGDGDAACAVSLVGQPPAPPAKVALWAYHVRVPGIGLAKRREGATLALQRGALTHLWTTGLTDPGAETCLAQTESILTRYEADLRARGLQVADHVQRTWFFVQNVDANYHGLVAARKAFFASLGLTPQTHYIASTGIEGTSTDIRARVMLDAYAIAGVRQEQLQYLSAPEYLCPTHCYGVTFERGTAIAYRDRKHILISGTASIDRDGAIVHPGDVRKQLARTLENVRALLQQAGASLEHVGMYLVYVRDPSDLAIARRMMEEQCGGTPMQVVTAPVCRPGWLIEVECQAIVPADNAGLPEF